MKNLEDIKAPKESVENSGETNENISSQNINNNPMNGSNTEIPENQPESDGGSNVIKFIIALVILIGVGAGSVFAYMQVNPFFLKSKEDVFKEILTNTYDRISQGNFAVDSVLGVSLEESGSEINSEIPFKILVSEVQEEQMPNLSFSLGNVDLSPAFDYTLGGMIPTSGMDNIFSGELRFFDDSLFLKVESVPEILTMFLPPAEELINKYENRWISSSIEEVESVTGVEVTSEDEISKEDLDYIFDRLSQAILEDSNPVIDTEKEGENTKIVYSVDFVELGKAIESAAIDIENRIGEEFIDDESMAEFTETEDITGTYTSVMYVDSSLVINKMEANISLVDEVYGTPVEMTTSLVADYIYDDNIVIDRPNSEFTVEDLMGDVMMLMFMGMGSGEEQDLMGTEDPFAEDPFFGEDF